MMTMTEEMDRLAVQHFANLQAFNFWADTPGGPALTKNARHNAERCRRCLDTYNAIAALCGAELVELLP